jgi:hypothetical protein
MIPEWVLFLCLQSLSRSGLSGASLTDVSPRTDLEPGEVDPAMLVRKIQVSYSTQHQAFRARNNIFIFTGNFKNLVAKVNFSEAFAKIATMYFEPWALFSQ